MTVGRGFCARMRAPLAGLEHDVMQAIWESGPSSVEALHEIVARNRDLKETSTWTILRRLEQKVTLQHEEKGRAYVYHAVELARSLAARAVRQTGDTFCRGSVEELVSGLVEASMLSKANLATGKRFVSQKCN